MAVEDDRRARVRELLQEGRSDAEIREVVGVNELTLQYWYRDPELARLVGKPDETLLEQAAAEQERARREAEARAEHERYRRAIGTDGCSSDWSDDRARYEVLREYARNDERDRAIAAIEACRATFAGRARREGPKWIEQQRREFAAALEDAFDQANPLYRGGSSRPRTARCCRFVGGLASRDVRGTAGRRSKPGADFEARRFSR